MVSTVTAAVEHKMSSTNNIDNIPTFDPKAQQFDQGNFSGRFLQLMLLGCDPRLLLSNEDGVRQYLKFVKDYQNIEDIYGTKET